PLPRAAFPYAAATTHTHPPPAPSAAAYPPSRAVHAPFPHAPAARDAGLAAVGPHAHAYTHAAACHHDPAAAGPHAAFPPNRRAGALAASTHCRAPAPGDQSALR